jgi:hypothetical protein
MQPVGVGAKKKASKNFEATVSVGIFASASSALVNSLIFQ